MSGLREADPTAAPEAGIVEHSAGSSAARSRRRALVGWIAIGAVLLVFGVIGVLVSGSAWQQRALFDPDGAGPDGTRALAQILREQGVEVVVARDRESALAALGPGTTLVMPDPLVLSDEAVEELTDAADDTVLVAPSARTARLLLDSEPRGLAPASDAAPECAQPDAVRAGSLVPRQVFARGAATHACYPAGDGYALLVRDDGPSSRTALVDGRELFTNQHLADAGNAALGLGLMGRHDRLVWYMPAPSDSDLAGEPELGELTPPWVTPALVLLAAAGIAAAVWRGRRFGPLVAENLPVTVRAAETMEGRARLSERAGDATGAFAVLRDASAGRIAAALGLARSATADEVAAAAAERLAVDPTVTRAILLGAAPADSAALVSAVERLRDLEDAVRTTLREPAAPAPPDPTDPTERTRR